MRLSLIKLFSAVVVALFVGCYYDNNSLSVNAESSDIYPIVGEWYDYRLPDEAFNIITFKSDGSALLYYTDNEGEAIYQKGTYDYDKDDESVIYIDFPEMNRGENVVFKAKFWVDDNGDDRLTNNLLYFWDITEDEVIDDSLFTTAIADQVYKRRR